MQQRSDKVRLATPSLWRPFQSFFQLEASSGILLIAAAAVALVWANSPWSPGYFSARTFPFGFTVGDYTLVKGAVLWINDGLMAVFFFLVGLEIKREFLGGELSSLRSTDELCP